MFLLSLHLGRVHLVIGIGQPPALDDEAPLDDEGVPLDDEGIPLDEYATAYTYTCSPLPPCNAGFEALTNGVLDDEWDE